MKIIKLTILLLFSNIVLGQECATELLQSQLDFMDQTRSIRDAIDLSSLDGQTINIPLVPHIIRKSDGTGGLSVADLNTSMNQLNSAFQQLNFEFELCDINYIDNDNYYNGINYSTSSSSEEYQMAVPNRIPDAVNVFFVPYAGGYCGWSSFPAYLNSIGKDWTIMANGCTTNGSTLAHELGHYFNLYHTHQGPSSGISIFDKELVDGSNCGPNVGDELCDTPADPNLSGCVNSSCNYYCNYTDANGDSYNPDPTNIMSYSQKLCRTFFSSQQIIRMLQSFILDRNYLAGSCNGCEISEIISGSFSSGSVESFEVSDWIESTATINSGADITYNAGNIIRLKSGFWAKSGCNFHAFIDGCSNNSNKVDYLRNNNINTYLLDQNPSLTIFPNPVTDVTNIVYELPKESVINISIYDLTGRQIAVLEDQTLKAKGKHELQFHTTDLPSGIYHIKVQAEAYNASQKLVISR